MDREVEAHIRACVECCANDKSLKVRTPPMTIVEVPEELWSKLAMDIVGPIAVLPYHQRFVISLVDYTSKWLEIRLVAHPDSNNVIKFLTDVFAREGLPCELVTDNGVQFVSLEMESFLRNMGIKHKRCSLYHPQGNGMVERMNRMIMECVRGAALSKLDVENSIRAMLRAHRNTPNGCTGLTPFSALRGRKAIDRLCPAWLKKFAVRKSNGNTECEEKRKLSQNISQAKYKARYDSRKHVKAMDFAAGQWVRVKLPETKVRKGEVRYSYPQMIVSVSEGGSAVRLANGQWWNTCRVVKVSSPEINLE